MATVTLISNTGTLETGRTMIYTITDTVVGDTFNAGVYSQTTSYTATTTNNTAAAAGLANAVNNFNWSGPSYAQAQAGYPPSATYSGNELTLTLNYQNQFFVSSTSPAPSPVAPTPTALRQPAIAITPQVTPAVSLCLPGFVAVNITDVNIGVNIPSVDIYHTSTTPGNLLYTVSRADLISGAVNPLCIPDTATDIIISGHGFCNASYTVNIAPAPTPVPVAPTPVAPSPVAPSPVAPTPTAPTPSPSVTPTPSTSYNYYFMRQCAPGNLDRVVRTTDTFNSSDPSTVSIFGTCYYMYNTATESQYNSNAGDQTSWDVTGYTVFTSCQECQGDLES